MEKFQCVCYYIISKRRYACDKYIVKGDERMSVTTSVISTVLKAVAGDKFGSGLAKELIGISIDGISEKGIKEIADFIDAEKSKIESILSRKNLRFMGIPEDNIDYVVAEIKDLLSWIDITDEVLRRCRYDNIKLKDLMWKEYVAHKNEIVQIECENDIKECLFIFAKALIELICKSEGFSERMLVRICNSSDDTNVGLQKISEYLEDNFGKLDDANQAILELLKVIIKQNQEGNKKMNKEQKIESRTQEYADNWNANMFLNDFDKRDQTAGTNVKLQDVYLEEHLPHYIWCDNEKNMLSTDLKELLSEYINEEKDNKMLLILGQPGIGKSTLITWITVNFVDRINDILVYRFAPDLGGVDWQNERISNRILEELGLSINELNSKILILDGFDEVNISNNRRELLDSLYGDWVFEQRIKNFSLIITCRVNYIEKIEKLNCAYITLQTWDEIQIKSFCNIFQEKTKNKISQITINKLIESKAILGIPLIMYIVLALNIYIAGEGSIVDVYDKIFSLDGGIYDRCIDNKKFANNHRIGEIKKQIHQVSREIAVWIFENNSEEACITKEEYRKICMNVMYEQRKENAGIQQDSLIGNYFKLVRHCEGIETEKIYFVHRSIYEYFVAETIVTSVTKGLDTSKEMLACIFGKLLKKGRLSENILNYLKHKIVTSGLYHSYNTIDETFQLMINNGMTFYINERYKNIIDYEIKIFDNMLEILHLWNRDKWKFSPSIRNYLKYGEDCCLNLIRTDLSGIDLREVNLSKSKLDGIDLGAASLKLIIRLIIKGELSLDLPALNKLAEGNELLKGTIFSQYQIYFLYDKYDLRGTIVIMEEGNIMSYEKFEKTYLW